MSIVIGGKRIDTSKWFESCCWLDDPKRAPQITDFDPRTRWCRSIVTHTAKGMQGPLRPGRKESTRAESLAKYQVSTDRYVSWDWTIDTDCTVIWQNDPLVRYSWHATAWNSVSLGGELVQDNDGALYEDQLGTYVLLMDMITLAASIQRQIPIKDGKVLPGVLPRADEKGSVKGADLVGIFAHHHNTKNRGEGDPGTHPFRKLLEAGYEGFDVNAGVDLATWKTRQTLLGLTGKDIDGLPGKKTTALIHNGVWVQRPGDADMMAAILAAPSI